MRASLKTPFAAACILSLAGVSAPIVSAQTPTSYQCQTIVVVPGTTAMTRYVSGVFQADAQLPAVNTAWKAYISATYHINAPGSCVRLGNEAQIQSYMNAQQQAWTAMGGPVIPVNFTFTPAQAAASGSAASIYQAAPGPAGAAPAAAASTPAPAPASSQGDQPRASYCFSDVRKPTVYFSDAFDTAGLPSGAAWSGAFTKFLAQKYKYTGAVTCKNSDTIMNALSMFRDQRDGLQGKQVVETDWTYEAPASPK